MRILGVDFGEKRIGLAIADDFLAEPLGTVKSKKALVRVCQKQGIEKIIIGISEGKMAKKTRRFGEKLGQLTGLPIEYQDETLTTKQAEELMLQAGKSKKRRQRQTDTIAATLILQNYLDRQASTG